MYRRDMRRICIHVQMRIFTDRHIRRIVNHHEWYRSKIWKYCKREYISGLYSDVYLSGERSCGTMVPRIEARARVINKNIVNCTEPKHLYIMRSFFFIYNLQPHADKYYQSHRG